eukprot:SAG31_NODE_30775_length_376_cov_0.787004_1_plen_22_part_10
MTRCRGSACFRRLLRVVLLLLM